MIRANYEHPAHGTLYLVRGSWCVYRVHGHERELIPVDDQDEAWRAHKRVTPRGTGGLGGSGRQLSARRGHAPG